MPTVEDFQKALSGIKMTDGQSKMLQAHLNSPDRTITSSELAAAAGYKSYRAANLHYGNLGKSIALFLGTTPEQNYDNGTPIWTFMIADGWRVGHGEEWKWRMHPELVKALES